jgi:uncharacterized small protein (DUF1192 family)
MTIGRLYLMLSDAYAQISNALGEIDRLRKQFAEELHQVTAAGAKDREELAVLREEVPRLRAQNLELDNGKRVAEARARRLEDELRAVTQPHQLVSSNPALFAAQRNSDSGSEPQALSQRGPGWNLEALNAMRAATKASASDCKLAFEAAQGNIERAIQLVNENKA